METVLSKKKAPKAKKKITKREPPKTALSIFEGYKTQSFYDEYFEADGTPRPVVRSFLQHLGQIPATELYNRQHTAEKAFLNLGITFSVGAGKKGGIDRIFPFDIIPRMIEHREWQKIEAGLKQRIRALNLFLQDIYNEKRILKDRIIPKEIIRSGKNYLKACEGLRPPQGIWCHITGTDLVWDKDGTPYVLEDNLRCPSGVSYVLENRSAVKKAFPGFFRNYAIEPVVNYPEELHDMLRYIAPNKMRKPMVVVLTPGIYNSAYFEHSILAQRMGVQLVEGRDLVVQNKKVYMKTTGGLQRVDVIYRRIDDVFLDPKVFRSDSVLGVAGLMEAYRSGNVSLANAPGTGIADDKVVYKFVPDMIRYYLTEEPILANVPTYLCLYDKERKYVLENLQKMVVKPANEAGGYGMLMGPSSTEKERRTFAALIKKNPRDYLAQPVLSLSRVPTLIGRRVEGRHTDLRPYILYGKNIYVMPGGLTRVALKKGSLIVNSSQGGGSKDTWVLRRIE